MNFNQLQEFEFNKFKEIIYAEAGIKLSDLKRALVQARLSRRIRALSLGSYQDYYEYLIENFDIEKENFINSITTNKTEFFRENKHFDFMRAMALPEINRASPEEIRIWSAGCSTGEEPYSIAITVMEYFAGRRRPAVRILATDIDTQVLARAETGIYFEEQVENIELDVLKKYFLKKNEEGKTLYKVNDSIKEMVYFRHLNLHMEKYPMKKQFDIIFCRNVIIYFDKEMQIKLFSRFHDYLSDKGYIMIGHSENISNISNDFASVGNTIYKKNR